MRASNSPTSNMISENKSCQILGYSDDIEVIERTKLDIKSIFLEILGYADDIDVIGRTKLSISRAFSSRSKKCPRVEKKITNKKDNQLRNYDIERL